MGDAKVTVARRGADVLMRLAARVPTIFFNAIYFTLSFGAEPTIEGRIVRCTSRIGVRKDVPTIVLWSLLGPLANAWSVVVVKTDLA